MPIFGLPPAVEHPLWDYWFSRSYAVDAPTEFPAFLHHYVPSLGVLRSILSTQSLWASEMRGVDDDREFDHGLPIVLAALESVRDSDLREHATLIGSGLRDRFLHEVFVSCLSTSPDLESQWDRYSDSQRGFVITFDNQILSALDAPNGLRLLPVEYDEAAQRSRARRVVELAMDHLAAVREPRGSPAFIFAVQSRFTLLAAELFFLCTRFKATKWNREQEWRIVYSRGLAETTALPVRTRRSGGRKLRYVQIDLTRRSFQHSAPTFAAVTAGPKASRRQLEIARQYVQSHHHGVEWREQKPF